MKSLIDLGTRSALSAYASGYPAPVTIRFMAPDLPSPSGGIKVIYRFVEHLQALGHDACVWHGRPGFRFDSWTSSARVETGLEIEFAAGDVLVVPETGGVKWSFLAAGQPVVMLCQGIDFVFANSGFLEAEPGDYPGWPDAVAAIAASEAIATFLQRACSPGFAVHHVPVEIEDYFAPAEKERLIALMPRRRREDLLGTVGLLQRSGRLGDWRILLIDDMTQEEVAAALGRSAIFLFGAEREGFGLPGAEAMASGCYVVGYTGDGAKEYLLPAHSAVIPESDVVTMADRTLEAMRTFDEDPDAFAATTARARAFVTERYAAARVRDRLDEAFGALLADGSAARFPRAATMRHFSAYGPPTDLRGRLRVAARSTGRRLLDRAGRGRG